MQKEFSEQIRQRIRTGNRPDPNSVFALYIRLCRNKQKLSMDMLSKRSDLSKATLYAIESGYLLPKQLSRQEYENLEQALGVSYEQFFKLNRHIIEEMTSKKNADKWNISINDDESVTAL